MKKINLKLLHRHFLKKSKFVVEAAYIIKNVKKSNSRMVMI